MESSSGSICQSTSSLLIVLDVFFKRNRRVLVKWLGSTVANLTLHVRGVAGSYHYHFNMTYVKLRVWTLFHIHFFRIGKRFALNCKKNSYI